MTPALVSFSDEQFKQLLNAIAAKPLPEPMKTTPTVKFAPHLHDVFSFTAHLANADPTRIHECLQAEAKEWYESKLKHAERLGMATSTRCWINMLETKFRYTAGKASVTPQQEQQEQGKHDTKHDTQTASTSAQPNHPQITMQPPDQDAPGSDTFDTSHDTQHNTQMSSTPAHPNPQPNTVQTPAQRAPPAPAPAPAPERFKQEVDYKYDGPCIMRHRNKLINTVDLNTVNFMMSTPSSNHLIQLQYQARGGSHFAYFWSNSRPPGLRTLTRLIFGDLANRTGLAGPFLKNHDNVPGRDSDTFRPRMHAPSTLITQPPLHLFVSFLHSELHRRRHYVRSYAYGVV